MLEVDRLPLARAIEVDDVQRPRTRLHEAAGGLERIVRVDGLAREVAALEPDGLAAADVDSGQEDHAARASAAPQIRVKFERSRRPADPDFSGWNCTP